jgi:hypothetical protein
LGDQDQTAYVLDSTTIDLCPSLFPWAHFRSTKSAAKMHTLLDLLGNIPSFIHVSDGKMHDVQALDMILPEAGAIYVMDRGYIDFARLHGRHQAGAFFVTRIPFSVLLALRCSRQASAVVTRHEPCAGRISRRVSSSPAQKNETPMRRARGRMDTTLRPSGRPSETDPANQSSEPTQRASPTGRPAGLADRGRHR